MIADECQTGMGRTGTFLACEALGVRPDYLILSKTLGGGLAKLAALLVGKQRYRDSFDLQHSSTFADDDFSCALGLKTLELIDQSVLDDCREKGDRFLARLHRLQLQYPQVIAGVRGRGLLIGLEFRPLAQSPSSLVRFLSSQGQLIPLLAGYLLLFAITWRDLNRITQLADRDPALVHIVASLRMIFVLYCFFALLADLCLNPITYVLIGLVVTMRRYLEGLPAAVPRPALATAR